MAVTNRIIKQTELLEAMSDSIENVVYYVANKSVPFFKAFAAATAIFFVSKRVDFVNELYNKTIEISRELYVMVEGAIDYFDGVVTNVLDWLETFTTYGSTMNTLIKTVRNTVLDFREMIVTTFKASWNMRHLFILAMGLSNVIVGLFGLYLIYIREDEWNKVSSNDINPALYTRIKDITDYIYNVKYNNPALLEQQAGIMDTLKNIINRVSGYIYDLFGELKNVIKNIIDDDRKEKYLFVGMFVFGLACVGHIIIIKMNGV